MTPNASTFSVETVVENAGKPVAADPAVSQSEGSDLLGIADAWLPKPRILHPWPGARFTANYPRWEPGA